jgi:hypothetical protein
MYSLSDHQARYFTDSFGIWWVHSFYMVHDIDAWRKDALPPFYLQTTNEQILINSGPGSGGAEKPKSKVVREI